MDRQQVERKCKDLHKQESISSLFFVSTVTRIPGGVLVPSSPKGELWGMQDGLLSAALEIAQQRAAIQRRMKQAILDDDLDTLLVCAGTLCGVDATGIQRGSPEEMQHVLETLPS